MKYCVDCRYFTTKVKGNNRALYNGSCVLLKKNVYETNRECKDFKEEYI